MVSYDDSKWTIVFRLAGSVVPRVASRVIACAAIGGGLLYLERRGIDLEIPIAAHTVVGVALGLLLVFRTNASYDRWWEGRKLVGGMVNRLRNLVRQAAAYVEGDDLAAKSVRDEVRRLAVSLYVSIRQYLRGERKLDEHADLLSEAQRASLEKVSVPPQAINTWLSETLQRAVRAGRLTEERLRILDENLTAMCDLWGGCERIVKTPVPFAYAHHIKGFLLLFCLSVPFALLPVMHVLTPFASAVVAYGLFGIEEIAVEIEDPFGYDPNDLPLDAIGETIARDLLQTVSAA
jgi:putative membrane protein